LAPEKFSSLEPEQPIQNNNWKITIKIIFTANSHKSTFRQPGFKGPCEKFWSFPF
jgi:hypothetical protein